ncbi:MAG: putative zinc-binding metallopeptidase, partial [Chromatiales bacterium]|nr:putative zinc-binding metallopeptidase [Chromatiales bacterium]
NSLNRSMGQQDLYPFVLSNAAIEKLKFIHKVMRSRQSFLEGYLANFDTQELERLARRGLSAGLDWLWGRVFR